MTSPTGAAMRRTTRPATSTATGTPTPRTGSGTSGGPPRGPPGPPGPPKPPERSLTAIALATKVSPKNSANRMPKRLGNRRRPPPHPPGPRGGNGSVSGHHGGRRPGPRRSGIGEPVPDAVDGEQVPGASRHRLELLADVLDMGVNRPLVGLERDAVDRVQELATGEHAARLAHQRRKELELGRGQLDRPAGDRDAHAADVDLDIGHPEDLRPAGPRRLGPPQHGTDPRDQLLGPERLHDVVVGPELEADHPVGLVAPRGQHHDRHVRRPPQRARDIEAVPPGQAEVEHDQVGPGAADVGECGVAVARHEHLEPCVLQVVADEPRDLRLVLDDQDQLHPPPPVLPQPDEAAGRRQASAPSTVPASSGAGVLTWPRPHVAASSRAGRLALGARRLALGARLLAGLLVLPAVPLIERGRAALPPRARAAPATRAVPGTAPATAPEDAARQQEDPDHQQREQDEPEREEPVAVPVAVPVAAADHPDHIDVLAAADQLVGDPLGDPQVVGADPDPDRGQDPEEHQSDDNSPSHLNLLLTLTGSFFRDRWCPDGVKDL